MHRLQFTRSLALALALGAGLLEASAGVSLSSYTFTVDNLPYIWTDDPLPEPYRLNGAYLRPNTLLPRRLRRGGPGTVSNKTRRLSCCISLRVAWSRRHSTMATRNHSYCSRESATLTVLPLTLRVHW